MSTAMANAEIDVRIDGEWVSATGLDQARRAVTSLTGSVVRTVELVRDPMERALFRVELYEHELEEVADWGDLTESNDEYRLIAWLDTP